MTRNLFYRKCATLKKRIKRTYYILQEFCDNFKYSSSNKERFGYFRECLCGIGLHWPIVWDENAYPSYIGDPPEAPSPDFCCGHCGVIKEPYRAVFWRIKEKVYGN